MVYLKTLMTSALLLLASSTTSSAPLPAWQQSTNPAAEAVPFSVLIAFGYGEPVRERWAGSVKADGARISAADGWVLGRDDTVALDAFDLQTINTYNKKAVAKGIILRGTGSPASRISVTTGRGAFSFRLSEVTPGAPLSFLNSAVRVSGMLEAQKLTDDSRNDDYPSIAVLDDTTAWVVWQSYSGRMDEIRLAKYDRGWRTFTRVPGVSGDVWRPQAALDRDGLLWITWAQQVDGNFDIYARALDEKRNTWLKTVRLSSHPYPDIDHHFISDGRGNLWVVWQGFHGSNADVFLRRYDGSAWSEEIRITDDPANDWEPQVAVDSRGRAHVVWDTYRNGNYDVYMRALNGDRLGPEIPVARTALFEAHATVAIDREDRVWVAWDEGAANWGKDSGPTTDAKWLERGRQTWDEWIKKPSAPGARIYESRQLNVAVFAGGRREAPAQDLRSVLAQAGETDHDYPLLCADPLSGRMALLFHHWGVIGEKTQDLYPRSLYWEQGILLYEGNRWSPIMTLPESWGRISMRGDAAFSRDGSLCVAWPTDARLYRRSFLSPVANVFAGRIPLKPVDVLPELKTWEEREAETAQPVHPGEAGDVAAIRGYRTFVHGAENRIVRGDLHRHAEFSWDSGGGFADGSLFDYYRYMLDGAALDFGGVTDHNAGGDYEYFWWLTEKSCDMFHIPGAFATFYGYERSVTYPDGHRNIFHIQRGFPVVPFFTRTDRTKAPPGISAERDEVQENDTKLLYESLRGTGGISIPHTTATNMGTDWRDNDPKLEPVVEIFQGDRLSYEHAGAPRAARSAEDKPLGGYQEEGFLWNAYGKGIRIGTIASSDHWSTHISYAMVYTEQPLRSAIFDAIKKRHTYGATDNIILDYRMGEYFMGDDFAAASVPPLEIRVVGTSRVRQLEIIKDEKIVYSATPDRKDVQLTYRDQEAIGGTSYYYVRVVQDNREIAWGSPIWITRKP